MKTTLSAREYTPEDLLTMPNAKDHRYELEGGQLMERDMSMLSSWVGARCGRVLGNFCDERGLGWVLDGENSYQCFPRKPNRVRRPDVSFIKTGRVSEQQLRGGHVRIAPDLVAEVISPNDAYYDVQRRVREYLDAGVRLVWIINPDDQTVSTYRPDGSVAYLRSEQELSGEDIIQDFRCQVGALFPPGELLATLTDQPQ